MGHQEFYSWFYGFVLSKWLKLTGLPWWLRGWVKNLPAVQETRVSSLGQENPLGKGRATHSSFLAWRIPWTEEPWPQRP